MSGTRLPAHPQRIELCVLIQHTAAGLEVHGLYPVVPELKRVGSGDGVDDQLRLLLVSEGHAYPNVLKRVGQLTEEIADRFEAIRQELMHAVLDGIAVSHVVD